MTAKGYGNFHHYNGDTLQELMEQGRNRIEAQIKDLGYQITDYMSFDEYCAWIDSLPNMSGDQLVIAMIEKLQQLQTEECTCTDPERTCPACRHAAYRVWYLRQEPVDSHLEAQIEQQFETDF